MKTLQEIMIEKYPSNNENNTTNITENNNENNEEKQENNNIQNTNEKQENNIENKKIKKIITSILASLTILFLFYPYMNNIIKENTNIFFENEKPKMILFICYLIILTLISKIIFTIS